AGVYRKRLQGIIQAAPRILGTTKRARMKKAGFGMFLVCVFSLGCVLKAFAAVTPELQRAARENTFEVVMKKPEKDPVTYEKPLPLDLIPFIERTDAYRSVGTAFSLG